MNLGVTICEDAWQAAGLTPSTYGNDPIENLAEMTRQGVSLDATVNLSASPITQIRSTLVLLYVGKQQKFWATHSC